MITSHLMLVVEALGRNGRSARSDDSEGLPVSRLSRIAFVVGERLRQHSPPQPLSNHLRRDIGLDPLPDQDRWPW